MGRIAKFVLWIAGELIIVEVRRCVGRIHWGRKMIHWGQIHVGMIELLLLLGLVLSLLSRDFLLFLFEVEGGRTALFVLPIFFESSPLLDLFLFPLLALGLGFLLLDLLLLFLRRVFVVNVLLDHSFELDFSA